LQGNHREKKELTKKLSKPEERTAFDPNTNQIIPIKTDLASLNSASTSTSAKKSPIRKKRVRKSRWSSGFIAKPKAKPKPKDKDEDGEDKDEDKIEDKDKDTSVNANDLEQDNAEDSDFDGEVSLNETMGLKMDFNKLKQIEDDLVTRTENSTTEILEKVYTKLMECVSHYKGLYDRTQLPKDLEDKMANLLPQISTTPASTKRKVSTSSINSSIVAHSSLPRLPTTACLF